MEELRVYLCYEELEDESLQQINGALLVFSQKMGSYLQAMQKRQESKKKHQPLKKSRTPVKDRHK